VKRRQFIALLGGAATLELEISASLLARADEVIE
jgi:hypothetical protein